MSDKLQFVDLFFVLQFVVLFIVRKGAQEERDKLKFVGQRPVEGAGLPADCKPVGDTAKCPGRFNSEPGLPSLSTGGNRLQDFVTTPVAICSKIAAPCPEPYTLD